MRLTPMGKIVLVILFAGVIAGGWRMFGSRLLPEAPERTAEVPKNLDLPSFDPNPSDGGKSGQPVSLPSLGGSPCDDQPEVRLWGYAWNTHQGLFYAMGGPNTVKGSLMCDAGVNLKYTRQDMNDKLQEALITFAQAYKNGNDNPTQGTHFVTVMGDGSAAFLKGLNDQLRRIGPEYQAKIVATLGYSRGEDQFMGPQSWKSNPDEARGKTVATVVRDGDWNIVVKWAGDNNIPVNPSETTYDPTAINFINTADYIDAAQKFVAGYTEQRPEVLNGKRTGKTVTVTVDGVSTWTPGDVTVAKERGGLVRIVSTKEYSSQMPNVVIGIDKWMKDHPDRMRAMIQAAGRGGDAVKQGGRYLERSSAIAAAAFNEPNAGPDYWKKYFNGVTETDKKGLEVQLGGSSVNNLADMAYAFGLTEGGLNLVANTYTVFGNLVKRMYPDLVPDIYPASEAIDTSYVAALKSQITPTQIAQARPQYKAPPAGNAGAPRKLVSRRSWNIQFYPSSANVKPESKPVLRELLQSLAVAGGTTVEIHGHTDQLGNPATSKPLSQKRAAAIKQYLQKASPANFPNERIQVYAHGQDRPIAECSEADPAGCPRNRRVEVVLRATD